MRFRSSSTMPGKSDLHSVASLRFFRRLRNAGIVLDVVKANFSWFFRDGHAVDFVLKPHQAIKQRFRPRRATGYIDIDRNHVIDALENRIRIERTTHVGAGAHGDDPFRIRHLVVHAADNRCHLQRHGPGDDDQVRLPRTRTEYDAEPVRVEAGCTRRHHFDGTAGQTESHGPERGLPRPVENKIHGGGDDVLFESIFNPCRHLIRLRALAKAGAYNYAQSSAPFLIIQTYPMIRIPRNTSISTSPNNASCL